MSKSKLLEFLQKSLDSVVLVKLKGGKELRGKLRGLDMHMNLILDEAEVIIDDKNSQKLGTIIVRGDNVVLISPPATKE
ncbi:MAG: LSM domain-containing protein [Candidatus Baldrarchaeia archaeon]